MRGDSHTDHEDDHSGRRGKSPPAQPAAHPLEVSRFLPNIPHHVPGKEWRKLGLRHTAKNIPQLLVIFTIHTLHSIELSLELEVALEWQAYFTVPELQESLRVGGCESGAAFYAGPLLQSVECAHG